MNDSPIQNQVVTERPALQVSERTRRRDRNEREVERVKLLELARELSWLAREHPRFATPLNKLMVNVRLQAGPSHVKRERILSALRASPLCIDELMEETKFDKESLLPELVELETAQLVEVVDSLGRLPHERQRERLQAGAGSGGLWTRYWRTRRVGSSQTPQRRR